MWNPQLQQHLETFADDADDNDDQDCIRCKDNEKNHDKRSTEFDHENNVKSHYSQSTILLLDGRLSVAIFGKSQQCSIYSVILVIIISGVAFSMVTLVWKNHCQYSYQNEAAAGKVESALFISPSWSIPETLGLVLGALFLGKEFGLAAAVTTNEKNPAKPSGDGTNGDKNNMTSSTLILPQQEAAAVAAANDDTANFRCQMNALLGSVGAPALQTPGKDDNDDGASPMGRPIRISSSTNSNHTITVAQKRMNDYYQKLLTLVHAHVDWIECVDQSLEQLRWATAISLGRGSRTSITSSTIPLHRLELAAMARHGRLHNNEKVKCMPWSRLRRALFHRLQTQQNALWRLQELLVLLQEEHVVADGQSSNSEEKIPKPAFSSDKMNGWHQQVGDVEVISLAMLRAERLRLSDTLSEAMNYCLQSSYNNNINHHRQLHQHGTSLLLCSESAWTHLLQYLEQLTHEAHEAAAYVSHWGEIKHKVDTNITDDRNDNNGSEMFSNLSSHIQRTVRDMVAVEETVQVLRIALKSVQESFSSNDGGEPPAVEAWQNCRRIHDTLMAQLDYIQVAYFTMGERNRFSKLDDGEAIDEEALNGSIRLESSASDREEYVISSAQKDVGGVPPPNKIIQEQQESNKYATLVFSGQGTKKPPSPTKKFSKGKLGQSNNNNYHGERQSSATSLMPGVNRFSEHNLLEELRLHLEAFPPTPEVEINLDTATSACKMMAERTTGLDERNSSSTTTWNISGGQSDAGPAASLSEGKEDFLSFYSSPLASSPGIRSQSLPPISLHELASAIQMQKDDLVDEEVILE